MVSHRLLHAITFALAAFTAVEATQVMHRPANYKEAPNRFAIETDPKTNKIQRRATSKTSFAYFTNWGIYGANFQPTSIVSSPLTHVLYSFADTDASTGNIKLTDSYADEQKHFDGDSWSEPGNNLYGCLKQLYLIKLRQRNFKVLLSIGGWTYSQSGHFGFLTSASARATFVSDAVKFIEDYGFDGIDLDFEYPANSAQGQGLADLLTSLRTAFNQLASSKGDSTPYLITAAVAAGSENYANYVIPQMNSALSYWNLMAYDYAGSWLTYVDNQANLYGGARTGVSTDAAIKFYLNSGATAGKINLGMPLYGRAFEQTAGLGQSYSGIGPGTVEAGIYSYNTLPLAGAQVFENTTDVTSYSYDSSKKEFVSYDTPNIVKLKSQYVTSKGLSGSMFWELSTDKVGSESLVSVAANTLGSLDQTQNHINYPNSKWDNIRSNMGSGGSSTTVAPTTTVHTTTPGSTTTVGTGQCAGVTSWSASATYVGGNKAIYNGHLWTAQWWTLGDTPGGSAGVWVDNGAC
ncbi:carbohydrate-binding module family 5 protein [Macrolepiota fuliginosa MF-IS2]|uniref:Carbohydrate-binding module family 5 protein n=1 Tax=Macrolepiota fuliginosa MF-IS2 TaxID=1400762 RepID=A0A9P6C0H4_9AGAR|nr:carbohydrate-binding module family 5 protein [Macrolepiota fuliginosa MF-IS2]